MISDHEVIDDGGMLFDVEEKKNGRFTGWVRVYGRVKIGDVEYVFDRNVKVALKKSAVSGR